MMKQSKTKKSAKKTKELTILDEPLLQDEVLTQDESNTFETNVDASFFYTNDKAINQIDNDELFLHIQHKYPEIDFNSSDSAIKKQIVQFLNDVEFVNAILRYHNLSILDLVGKLYKKFSSIFKGQYLKKLKNEISLNNYEDAKL